MYTLMDTKDDDIFHYNSLPCLTQQQNVLKTSSYLLKIVCEETKCSEFKFTNGIEIIHSSTEGETDTTHKKPKRREAITLTGLLGP